jgi:hypothetical protein
MAKNLIGLAKGGNKKPVPLPTKPVVKKVAEKKLTPAEERDLKAKAKVEELLQDVNLSPNPKEDLIEIDENHVDTPPSSEWLEEQVTLLTANNELLRSELVLAKDDYSRLFQENQQLKSGAGIVSNDGAVAAKVIELFNELQDNHIKLGTDMNTGIGNFRIFCPGFLNRMIVFFPFLTNHRRY